MTAKNDPYPGRPFKDAMRLLRQRFPEGNLRHEQPDGEVLISLPLQDGGTFRAILTWQQAKYLAYSKLTGNDLKDCRFPPNWPPSY